MNSPDPQVPNMLLEKSRKITPEKMKRRSKSENNLPSSKKCFTCDDVFGNSFKRFLDGNEYVTEATKNCKFDFKKSAWYVELKRIYREEPELLLPGEREMIESWED